jgi:hypothetical protein
MGLRDVLKSISEHGRSLSENWWRYMASDRDRLTKALTFAIHPGTVPTEAETALHRARRIVEANPSLAYSALSEQQQPSAAQPEATYTTKITSVHPDWVLILVELLSRAAFELDIKYKMEFDFTESLTGVIVTSQGQQTACDALSEGVNWAVKYINDEIAKTHS